MFHRFYASYIQHIAGEVSGFFLIRSHPLVREIILLILEVATWAACAGNTREYNSEHGSS